MGSVPSGLDCTMSIFPAPVGSSDEHRQIKGGTVQAANHRGEDFAFVLVRTCVHLYSIRVLTVFDTLMYYLKAKFAIDLCAADLTFDLPRNAPVSVSYTLLDTFPCQFFDEGHILCLSLKLVPPLEKLSYHGECNLAY